MEYTLFKGIVSELMEHIDKISKNPQQHSDILHLVNVAMDRISYVVFELLDNLCDSTPLNHIRHKLGVPPLKLNEIVLAGIPRKDAYLSFKVWCPFCHSWHLHGQQSELNAGKVAHCDHDHIVPHSTYIVKKLALTQYVEIMQGIEQYLKNIHNKL